MRFLLFLLIVRIPVERIVGNQTGSVNFFEGDIERRLALPWNPRRHRHSKRC